MGSGHSLALIARNQYAENIKLEDSKMQGEKRMHAIIESLTGLTLFLRDNALFLSLSLIFMISLMIYIISRAKSGAR